MGRVVSLLADIDGNVWAVPDGGTQVIFDGMINLIWPLPDSYRTVTIGGNRITFGQPGPNRCEHVGRYVEGVVG